MADARIVVRVSIAWWLTTYLVCLQFFYRLHGTEPDWQKLERVIDRAITLKGGA